MYAYDINELLDEYNSEIDERLGITVADKAAIVLGVLMKHGVDELLTHKALEVLAHKIDHAAQQEGQSDSAFLSNALKAVSVIKMLILPSEVKEDLLKQLHALRESKARTSSLFD